MRTYSLHLLLLLCITTTVTQAQTAGHYDLQLESAEGFAMTTFTAAGDQHLLIAGTQTEDFLPQGFVARLSDIGSPETVGIYPELRPYILTPMGDNGWFMGGDYRWGEGSFLARINSDGSMRWGRLFPEGSTNYLVNVFAIFPTPENGCTVVGTQYIRKKNAERYRQPFIATFDSIGNMVWGSYLTGEWTDSQGTIGDTPNPKVERLTDGSVVICSSQQGIAGTHCVVIDGDGTVLQSLRLPIEGLQNMMLLPSGNLLLTFTSNQPNTFVAAEYSLEGKVLWAEEYQTPYAIQSSDAHLVLDSLSGELPTELIELRGSISGYSSKKEYPLQGFWTMRIDDKGKVVEQPRVYSKPSLRTYLPYNTTSTQWGNYGVIGGIINDTSHIVVVNGSGNANCSAQEFSERVETRSFTIDSPVVVDETIRIPLTNVVDFTSNSPARSLDFSLNEVCSSISSSIDDAWEESALGNVDVQGRDVTVTLPFSTDQVSIIVLNMLGKQVDNQQSKTSSATLGKQEARLSLPSLPAGSYIIWCQSEENVLVKKVLLN
ncbi:MAG: T9SS type A sorting domain-containing protein [Ignavibacteriae bacterium]|nr:T9SS type A sorting domain-containing protein [Ignavibacteriota bacterium]MCB9215401.1 T9SS type A sorting domain-containing protein [Ignavibacteria bacterium]